MVDLRKSIEILLPPPVQFHDPETKAKLELFQTSLTTQLQAGGKKAVEELDEQVERAEKEEAEASPKVGL